MFFLQMLFCFLFLVLPFFFFFFFCYIFFVEEIVLKNDFVGKKIFSSELVFCFIFFFFFYTE